MQHNAQETAASDVSAIEGREDDVRPDAMVLLERAPLILFDGVCNLCNAWVRFVVRL